MSDNMNEADHAINGIINPPCGESISGFRYCRRKKRYLAENNFQYALNRCPYSADSMRMQTIENSEDQTSFEKSEGKTVHHSRLKFCAGASVTIIEGEELARINHPNGRIFFGIERSELEEMLKIMDRQT